jgi:hypothetical protein
MAVCGIVGRRGEQRRVDQEREQDAAHAACAALPDRSRADEAEQNGEPGAGESPEESGERGFDLEKAEADDQDRDHDRHHGKYREVARPRRNARHGLRLVGSGKPAGHGGLVSAGF